MPHHDSDQIKRTYWTWRNPPLIYMLVIIFGYALVPTVWGFTNGIILGMKIVADPMFQKEIATILTKEEVEKLESSYFGRIPDEKRNDVEIIVGKYLQGVAWLPIHIVSNFITFGVIGLVVGLIKVHRYWFIIPLLLLPATLTLLNGPFIVRNWGVTLAIVILLQVVSINLGKQLGIWTSNHLRKSTGQTR